MKAQSGSEILDQLNEFTIKGAPELGSLVKFSEVAKAINGKIVVPSETWDEMEKMTEQALKEALEQDAKLEKIKSLIESFPKAREGEFCYYIWGEIEDWKKEFREAVEG